MYKNTTQLFNDRRTEVRAEKRVQRFHDFHLKLVLARMDFLCSLYRNETGIPFTEWNNRPAKQTSFAIGSVTASRDMHFSGDSSHRDSPVMASMGLSMKLTQSLTQTQRLEMTLALCPLRLDIPTIELEMGLTLEDTLKRSKFIDWVMPHELAHIVDWKCGEPTVAFVNDHASRIEEVAQLLPAHAQEAGRILIASQLGECVIDGIGFQLARDLGVSALHLAKPTTKPGRRVPHILSSFLATCDTVCKLSSSKDVTIDQKAALQILLLRLDGVGKSLVDASRLPEKKLGRVQSMSERLKAQIDSYETETAWLSMQARNEIITLFQEGFRGGAAFPIPRRDKKRQGP